MSAALLDELIRLDVRVGCDGDQLLVDGPEHVLTDELLAVISAAKPALLMALSAMAGGSAGADGREGLDAVASPEATVDPASPSPWRCFACGSGERRHRETWGDWVCAFCRAIVAGPDRTERPWRMKERVGPFLCAGPPTVTWGSERGYLAVRDPFTGDWHQIPYREAPPVWQAAVRRRRAGDGERRP